MKKEIITYDSKYGENITLYAIIMRVNGTRKVYGGVLLHNNRYDDCEYDRITGGVVGMNVPESPEEADILIELSRWHKDYYVDGNGCYVLED